MRGKDRIGLCLMNFGDHLFDRRRRKGRLRGIARRAGHDHGGFLGKTARVKDLRPAIREPAVAHDQRAALAKLARHGLHRIGAATRHKRHGAAVIDVAQHGRDIAHHTLEARRHVVQAAIGENDRELLQATLVDMVVRQFHRGLLCSVSRGRLLGFLGRAARKAT